MQEQGAQSQKHPASVEKVIAALRAAWENEIDAAQYYRLLAEAESDTNRKSIFERLAVSEETHAQRFADRIRTLGADPPARPDEPGAAKRMLVRTLGADALLRRMEAEEERNIERFARHASSLRNDLTSYTLFTDIEAEEKQHAGVLRGLHSRDEPRTRLEAIFKGEKWHVSTGSWIGDSIYGINDGLGAVFGVVSGMAGLEGARNLHLVLASGLFAMLASALSMGTSAFMAGKSEREVYQAEIAREKKEIEQSPEHEKEELQLLYQLKGFSESEAEMMTERIAAHPETFLKTMVQEELGLSERHFPNPMKSAFSAAISTAVGGIIPVIPFFFWHGGAAVLAAAIIGMAAHFAVGALKSIITTRSWVASGLEMTAIGFLSGGVTYGIGVLSAHLGGL